MRKVAKIQEKRIVKNLSQIMNARQQMASGSVWFAKGDVTTENFLIEAKTRAKKSKQITLKKEWLDKIAEEAVVAGKIPVLAISFGDGRDFFILSTEDFLSLVQASKGGGGGENN